MYRSRIRIPVQTRKEQLGQIFSIARSNNKRLDVFGALLLSEHWFVQILEGAEDAVRGLYAVIEPDIRLIATPTGSIRQRADGRHRSRTNCSTGCARSRGALRNRSEPV